MPLDCNLERCAVDDSFFVRENLMTAPCWEDPMWDEVEPKSGDGRSVPMLLQCSVESPATKGAPLLFQRFTGFQVGSELLGEEIESSVHTEELQGDGVELLACEQVQEAALSRCSDGPSEAEHADVVGERVLPCVPGCEYGTVPTQVEQELVFSKEVLVSVVPEPECEFVDQEGEPISVSPVGLGPVVVDKPHKTAGEVAQQVSGPPEPVSSVGLPAVEEDVLTAASDVGFVGNF